MNKFTDILATATLVILPIAVIILVWITIAMEILEIAYPGPW